MPPARRQRLKLHSKLPRLSWTVGGGSWGEPLPFVVPIRPGNPETRLDAFPFDGHVIFAEYDGDLDTTASLYERSTVDGLNYDNPGNRRLEWHTDRIVAAFSRFTAEGIPGDEWFAGLVDDVAQWQSFEATASRVTPVDNSVVTSFAIELVSPAGVKHDATWKFTNFAGESNSYMLSAPIGGRVVRSANGLGRGPLVTTLPANTDLKGWTLAVAQTGVETLDMWGRLTAHNDVAVPLQGQRGEVRRRSAQFTARGDERIQPGWIIEHGGEYLLINTIERTPDGYMSLQAA